MLISLITDYLNNRKFEYTQSVFLPETGYEKSVLSRGELFEILNLGGRVDI